MTDRSQDTNAIRELYRRVRLDRKDAGRAPRTLGGLRGEIGPLRGMVRGPRTPAQLRQPLRRQHRIDTGVRNSTEASPRAST